MTFAPQAKDAFGLDPRELADAPLSHEPARKHSRLGTQLEPMHSAQSPPNLRRESPLHSHCRQTVEAEAETTDDGLGELSGHQSDQGARSVLLMGVAE